MIPELARIVPRVPEWRDATLSCQPLTGGYSHKIYLVTADRTRYVLRILNEEIEQNYLGIPAVEEIRNTVAAAASGAAPAVFHAFPDIPAMVLEYIDGMTMHAEMVRLPANTERAGRACRMLHDRSAPFRNRFSIFRQLDDYLELRTRIEWPMPDGGEDLIPVIRELEPVLDAKALPLRPCHNDLLPENLIDSPSGIRIIDFQVAGMNDPCFDLGDLAADAGLDPDGIGRLCTAYFGETDACQIARTRLFLLAARLTWSLWFAVHAGVFPHLEEDGGYWREAMRRWSLLVRDLAETDLTSTRAEAAGRR